MIPTRRRPVSTPDRLASPANPVILILLACWFNPTFAAEQESIQQKTTRPNIILIMADDMGRECLQCYGGESYKTPNLNRIAQHGAQFNHCYSTPICTTSRVQIMTGKYNYHNYECFAYLNPKETTFGNILQDAGYKTMIAGKWQLNGHNARPPRKGWQNLNRPNHFGFDQWHLWQVSQRKRERYWGANLVVNGQLTRMPNDSYSPDYFTDRIIAFIEQNKKSPFFVYFPMLLTHDPFVRTPSSKDRQPDKQTAFSDMVRYTDTIVGRIDQCLRKLKIEDNTILIFTGDNGTPRNIVSNFKGKPMAGGKAMTHNAGIHVPLLCKWPGKINAGLVVDDIVDFTDFMPTLHELAQSESKIETDGISFTPALGIRSGIKRQSSLCHYDCRWGKFPATQFAYNQQYKVYRDGPIFDVQLDPLEQNPIQLSQLSATSTHEIDQLRAKLNSLPKLNAASLTPGPRKDHKAAKPNIILLMADDLGWGDVGFNGNKTIKTPQLDAMADAGLKFNRFYAQSAVCSPTRGSCLTGRHPFRYGIFGANVGHLRAEEICLAEFLQRNGYRTGHFGKWHLGTLDSNFSGKGEKRNPKQNFMPPSQAGFDEWFSTEYAVATWDPYDPANAHSKKFATDPRVLYWHNGTNVVDPLRGDDSRIIMDKVLPFIAKSASQDRPFFTVVWFHAPHKPVVAGPKYREMYPNQSDSAQHYYGCITAMDEQIGRLRKHLRDNNLADNTMLCFCSDNGPEGNKVGEGTNWGTTAGLRGRKRSLYEGGIRVPAIIEWPERIGSGQTSTAPYVTSDYFPTIVEILDGDPDLVRNCDGTSMVQLFDGATRRHKGIGFRNKKRAVWMNGRYKLIALGDSKFELYDLIIDRSESNDLAKEKPLITKTLKLQLDKWLASFE